MCAWAWLVQNYAQGASYSAHQLVDSGWLAAWHYEVAQLKARDWCSSERDGETPFDGVFDGVCVRLANRGCHGSHPPNPSGRSCHDDAVIHGFGQDLILYAEKPVHLADLAEASAAVFKARWGHESAVDAVSEAAAQARASAVQAAGVIHGMAEIACKAGKLCEWGLTAGNVEARRAAFRRGELKIVLQSCTPKCYRYSPPYPPPADTESVRAWAASLQPGPWPKHPLVRSLDWQS